MIDAGLVKKSVALMGSFDAEETEKFDPVISAAVSGAAVLLNDDADENDPRVIQLAAAIAYRAICCTAEKNDNITSFTAGDITVKQETDALAGAESYYALAKETCKDLLKPEPAEEQKPDGGASDNKPEHIINDSFAFLGV